MKKINHIFSQIKAKIKNTNSLVLILIFIFLLLTTFLIVIQQREKQITRSNAADTTAAESADLTQYVNLFIGTTAGGNTWPGAAYPFGMVQWSPDTPSNPPGGYKYTDTVIKDFSLTHFSGRGCQYLQDIPFMPFVGNISVSPGSNPSAYYDNFSHANEVASPGYYKVHLDNSNVDVELTTTQRTGFGKFTYPASENSMMIVNAGGSIRGTNDSNVNIIDNNQITGYAKTRIGCGSGVYTIYFSALFNQPFTSFGTWNGTTISQGSTTNTGAQTGAFVNFDTTTNSVVSARVGISFVSIANAQANLAAENPNLDFSTVVSSSKNAWNEKLHSIEIQGGTPDQQTVFYTALYHSLIHPNIFNDVNGQYIGFDNLIHTVEPGRNHYENITTWDAYREQIALFAVLFPKEASDIFQSLVNDAQQSDGHLPRWEQANHDSRGMIGDGASPYITSGYAFGATDFNSAGALTAMIQGQANIREGFSDYTSLGYVSNSIDQSASRTLEYTSADFAVAQFANYLGDTNLCETYFTRSTNWKNLFHPTSLHIQPKQNDGVWEPNFNSASMNGFTEGSSAQYSWLVPYDLKTLFTKMGGNTQVISRLDTFFTKINGSESSIYSSMQNEPSFEVPWEYNFAGAPSKTQNVVRRVQGVFSNTTSGLSGNDDAGALSSWYILSALGLYPEIPGVGGFTVGSPVFTSATVHLGGGGVLQINAPGASDTNYYVQSLNINGNPTTNTWIPWSAIQNGAVLDFALVSAPTQWGTGSSDMSPSFPDDSFCGVPSPTTLTENIYALPPTRILDTRSALGDHLGALTAGETVELQILEKGGVPANNVLAVIVNLTVIPGASSGYLTLYPSDESKPLASNINFASGTTVANQALVKVGQDGKIKIYNSAGSNNIIVDVEGYVGKDYQPITGKVVSFTPTRILDTRYAIGAPDAPLGTRGEITLPVISPPVSTLLTSQGIDPSQVKAIIANITAIPYGTTNSFLTLYPSDIARPTVSNVNAANGRIVANLALVPLNMTNGTIKIYNNTGSMDVILDVQAVVMNSDSTGLRTVTPARILNTTTNNNPIGAGTSNVRNVTVLGAGGIPSAGVSAVVLHVTATLPTANGYFTVYPSGVSRPVASTLNFNTGKTVSNNIIVPVGANGSVAIYNSAGATHGIVDVQGWVASAP